MGYVVEEGVPALNWVTGMLITCMRTGQDLNHIMTSTDLQEERVVLSQPKQQMLKAGAKPWSCTMKWCCMVFLANQGEEAENWIILFKSPFLCLSLTNHCTQVLDGNKSTSAKWLVIFRCQITAKRWSSSVHQTQEIIKRKATLR